MKLEQHELSAAFPAMSDTELIALTDDVAAHGQRDAGTLFEGKVLDGWHRYQACELAGVEFKADQYIGDDPVGFVMSRNAHRRHLTASQRAAAIVLCSEWKPVGSNQHGGSTPGGEALSTKQMAEAAGVGTTTVEEAKTAVRAGLGGDVRDGKMSAKAAAKSAKPEKPKVLEPDDDIPTPPDEPEPGSDQEEADQAAIEAAQFKADFAVFYADDQNRHMVDQIRQLTAEVVSLRSRVTGLMGELSTARGLVKSWRAKAEKAEKERF